MLFKSGRLVGGNLNNRFHIYICVVFILYFNKAAIIIVRLNYSKTLDRGYSVDTNTSTG